MAVAPYLYNGWGSPPSPTTITNATGVKWFTLAFVLSNGYCNPQWDGSRPLTGGVDQQTVNAVRANGGDIIPLLRRLQRQPSAATAATSWRVPAPAPANSPPRTRR